MHITDMTIKELEAEIVKNEDKREVLFSKRNPIDRQLSNLYNKNKKLSDQIAKIKMNQKHTDWNWLLHCTHSESSMEKHRLREHKLRELNLGASGFFPEIEQTQIRIALVKNDPKSLPATMKGLKKILKYLKPAKGNYKVIDIFEHSLSAGGCFNLLINEEKESYKIHLTRYNREETLHSFNNLKETLALIQKKYYYDDADNKDN